MVRVRAWAKITVSVMFGVYGQHSVIVRVSLGVWLYLGLG